MLQSGRLCGLVVRVSGYRSRGPGSIHGAAKFFWEVVGLERGPLSLVSTIGELLRRKSSGSSVENREYGLEIRYADHVAPSISKRLQELRRQAGVARSV
jgi:hypothetical protein